MTLIRRALLALAMIAVAPALVHAQSTPVYQRGPLSAAHAIVKLTRNGEVVDAGSVVGDAGGRGVNPFAITDSNGLGLCSNSTANSGASGNKRLCFGHDASGNPIADVNGTTYLFPFVSNGAVGPSTTVAGHVPCWANTVGTLLSDCNYINNAYASGTDFYAGPTSNQWRFPGRALFGAAVEDTGFATPAIQVDWASQLYFATKTGLTCKFSTLCSEADVRGLAPSPSNPGPSGFGGFAIPHESITAIDTTTNGRSFAPDNYSTPRALGAYIYGGATDAPTGGGPVVPGWAVYIEAHKVTQYDGQMFGIENEVRELIGTSPTNWNSYRQGGTGGLIGIVLGSGAGLPNGTSGYPAMYPATAAMYITSNPTTFGSGIIVFDGAICACGATVNGVATKPALQLAGDQAIQWNADGTNLGANFQLDSSARFRFEAPLTDTYIFGGPNLAWIGLGTTLPVTDATRSIMTLSGTEGGGLEFQQSGVEIAKIFTTTTSGSFNIATTTSTPIIFATEGNAERMRIYNSSGGGNVAIAGSVLLGTAGNATLPNGALAFAKNGGGGGGTPSGPGAGFLSVEVVAGTTSGSCKLIAYAGTDATAVTVVDNVGSGC